MKILKNFIVFEGLDGAGTSTQSKLLNEKITNSIWTCEPTDNEIGKLIRRVLRKEVVINPKTLAMLFITDRNEHLYGKDGIIDSCNSGKHVICDRYLFSSLAYQGLDLPIDDVFVLNKDFILPEVVFFLNTSIEVCEKRIDNRDQKKEIFEDRSLQQRILANYIKGFSFFKDSGMRFYELDGSLPINSLLEKEISILNLINT